MKQTLHLRIARLKAILSHTKYAGDPTVDSLIKRIQQVKESKETSDTVFVLAKEFAEPNPRGDVVFIEATYINKAYLDPTSDWYDPDYIPRNTGYNLIVGAPLNEQQYFEFLDQCKPNKVIQLPPEAKTYEEYIEQQRQAKEKHKQKLQKLDQQHKAQQRFNYV